MEKSTEIKRGRGRPAKVDLASLLVAFDTLKQVSTPMLAITFELKTDTAFNTIKRAVRSQWVKRIGHGLYALTVKGEQKVQKIAI